jgi:glycosyltransferase involved in cell wall biosynthesis
MRLLITTDTVGGVWRFGIELVEGLLEAGESVALVSFGRMPTGSQRSECKRLSDRWGHRFDYSASDAPLEWMQGNSKSYEQGLKVIKQAAHIFGAEIFHSNQFCYGVCATELGIPVIVTAHSDVLSWAHACRGGVLGDTDWLRCYCALVQMGLDSAAAIAAPTEWMLRNLSMHFDLPRQRRIIANGIELPLVPSSPRELQAVTAGRLWDEAKGISLLRSVQSEIPFIVAGTSNCDGHEAALIPNAQYYGELTHDQLLHLFSRSAIYICTSRYEPFGLAPIEAALCGCAVVARDIESLREVWDDAAVYFDTAQGLSDILVSFAQDPSRLSAQQQLAMARAQRFTRSRMVAEYQALYATVLEKEYACAG